MQKRQLMVEILEEPNLENQKWKKRVSQWTQHADFGALISLLSIVFLFFQITKTQNELKSVSSKLLKLQNVVDVSISSIGNIEKNVFSLQSLKDVHTQKINQFENDLAKFEKRNNVGGSHNKYFKDDYSMGSKAIEMMPSSLHAHRSINLSDYLNSTRVDDELFSRKLQTSEKCDELSTFNVTIYLDGDPEETSWNLTKTSSNTDLNGTDDLIFHEEIEKLPDLSSKPYNFMKCIEPGSYMFSIYDSFGDGIRCRNRTACYEIHVGNKKIEGSRFSSEFSQTFSISPVDKKVCIGHHLQVQFDLDERFDGATWTLIKRPMREIKDGEIDISNGSFNFSTCVEPGYYHFMVVDSDGLEIFCEADRKCVEIRVDDKVIENIQIHPIMRQSFLISFEGNAKTPKCLLKPLLAPVNQLFKVEYDRIEGIMSLFTGLSSVSSLNDKISPQYQAACFILYDDVLELGVNDSAILERYVMSVLLFSTGRHAFVELPSNICTYRDVECNDEGNITEVNWGNQRFSGTIPTEIAQLRYLESVQFNNNELTGTIPTELGTMFYLKKFFVSNNNLRGPIPSQIGNLYLLTGLGVGGNDFSGSSIPSEIGNCGSLEHLVLTFSKLEGTIPPELFNARSLEWVYMGNNRLSGTIPASIGNLTKAKIIKMNDNTLHGTIPNEVGELSSVWDLWLGNNTLSGTLPSQLKQWSSLRELTLQKNTLSGTIPDIFGNLTHLKLLSVANNINLNGEIPDSLWKNDFKIPPDVEQPRKEVARASFVGNLSVFAAQNTGLKGTVPDEFCEQIDELKLEHTNWFEDEPKIHCPCCENFAHCYIWDSQTNMTLSCPNTSTKVIESDDFFFANVITIKDKISNQTLNLTIGANTNTTLCLSPTGCYYVKANSEEDFGYSSDSHALVDGDVCDSVMICGNEIHATHPKRKGLNHIMQVGVPNANILNEPESAHYKTLCWMMNEVNDAMPKDQKFDDYKICDGTLLQRFALGVFFHSQPEFFRNDSHAIEYFNETHEIEDTKPYQVDYFNNTLGNTISCEWPGIKCESNEVYVEKIITHNTALTKLVRELGFLSRLKYLDLSNSDLKGTLDPATFTSLPYLEFIDLSNNQLEGEIPKELLQIKSLKTVRLQNNIFEGTLPRNITYSEALEEFNVGSNLLKGNIPEDIMKCPNLKNLNFSKNYFDGQIPPTLGNLDELTNISLNENLFTGSIPSELFAAKGLEVIMLQSNSLTGSIPSELGSLSNLTIVSMSHNKLKGNIPGTLKELKNLECLQLHQNQLYGTAPKLDYLKNKRKKERKKEKLENINKMEPYITDCGQPNFALEKDLVCKSCTMCCNSLSQCQETQNLKIGRNNQGALCAIFIPLFVVLLSYAFMKLSRINGRLATFRVKETPYASDSVYHFIHSKEIPARLLFFVTASLQVALFYFYLSPSEVDDDDSDVLFSYRCPPSNNLNCIKVDEVDDFGWSMFGFVTFIYLGPDLVMSLTQIWKAVFIGDIPLLLGGVLVLALTSLGLFTSVVYNLALAASNTDLIMNAVILLFINDLDEKVLSILRYICPEWTKGISDEVKNKISRIDSEFMTRQNGTRHFEIKM